MVTKICKRCAKPLPAEDFYKRHLACKACCIVVNRQNYLRRVADPAKKDALRARERINGRNYRKRHPERALASRRASRRAYTLRLKFGITLKDYEDMLIRQSGACAICGFVPAGEDTYREGKCLAVDHNHDTGEVRGLLCDQCNRGIGQLKDDPALLLKAAGYLMSSSGDISEYHRAATIPGSPYVPGQVSDALKRYLEQEFPIDPS